MSDLKPILARIEAVLPHLATAAQVAELNGDLERKFAEFTGTIELKQAQFAGSGAVPEMLGLRRRFRSRARWLGHDPRFLPFGPGLVARLFRFLMRHWMARRQRSSSPRMPRIPAHALLPGRGCLYRYDLTR